MHKDLAVILKKEGIDLVLVADVLEFSKTALTLVDGWEKDLTLSATGLEDTTTIQLAGIKRKKTKSERISSEAFLKQKREGVQQEMSVFTQKDKALLKISQFVVERAKVVEAHLGEIENLPVIAEKKRLDEQEQQRKEKLSEVVVDTSIYNVREMSDSAFENVLGALILQKEMLDKAAKAVAEKELKEKEDEAAYNTRLAELSAYNIIPGCKPLILALTKELSEGGYKELKASVVKTHDDYQKEQIKVRQEAASLRVQQEATAKKLAEQTQAAKTQQEAADKKAKEQEAALKAQQAEAAKQAALVQLGRKRQNTLLELGFSFSGGRFMFDKHGALLTIAANDLSTLSDSIFNAKIEEVNVAITRGNSLPLTEWIEAFTAPTYTKTKDVGVETTRDKIMSKFEAFKTWAKKE